MESEKFMQAAVKEALIGIKKKHGYPFGAVIVRNGKIISSAHNTVYKTKDPTAHAEINAIRTASKKLKNNHLKDCELYSSSEPCPMCLSAIYWAKIKKAYYCTTKDEAEKIGFSDKKYFTAIKEYPEKQPLEIKKLQIQKGQKPFEEWAKKKRKQ